MNSLSGKPAQTEALSEILYKKAVAEIAKIAGDLTKVTIHGKSNFASAYLSTEGEPDVFNRLETTKYSVKVMNGHPVVIAHFLFKKPPEHERIFIQIIPEQKTSEYIKFEITKDGEFDIDELRPLSYSELTHLLLDLSLAAQAKAKK